jgi:hypothetical protein
MLQSWILLVWSPCALIASRSIFATLISAAADSYPMEAPCGVKMPLPSCSKVRLRYYLISAAFLVFQVFGEILVRHYRSFV